MQEMYMHETRQLSNVYQCSLRNNWTSVPNTIAVIKISFMAYCSVFTSAVCREIEVILRPGAAYAGENYTRNLECLVLTP